MNREFSYYRFFRELYGKRGQKYAFLAKTVGEFEQWKGAFRQEIGETFGLKGLEDICRQCGLQERFLEEVQRREAVKEKGYTREKYVMETLPGVFMPFYVLIPADIKPDEKRPAVIALPAHGANKDTVAGVFSCPEVEEKLMRTPEEAYGKALVQKGCIVICPDPPGYGERIEDFSSEDRSFASELKRNPLGSSCKDLAQTAEALGLSLTALVIWDLMRLVDFVQSYEKVDSREIGCVGFSGGGQYAMWLAAMDDRIGRAAVSGYVHGYYDSILDTHLCPCNYAPNLWLMGDISDICSLIAPRPLYIENGIHDVENGLKGIDGPKEQVERIRNAYRLFGKEELLIHEVFDGGHMWYGGCLGNGFFHNTKC
ncbi:MAG: alpha/beta hydrolase family protein [Blautia sp.]|nr:alpha/beta hydrolase family protein [Blautia sp.]MCM1201417.1 alpha/beta hydrolase family protein [Bacteroides fragilis]